MDPFLIPRAILTLFLFGVSVWVRLLGPSRGRKFVAVGMVVSAVVCVVLELKGV